LQPGIPIPDAFWPYTVQVVAGGPAFLAGLRRGDQIMQVDGMGVAEHCDVEERLRGDGYV
jgi:C-terminal processing protease CtpA/Prc